ncbi:MAG: hypothetical protein ABW107_03170 [Candidatus Thiodiazotropha sp. 6PLUC5]
MLHFMDAKAMLFVQNWEEAICTSHKKHKFRTHTKQELNLSIASMVKVPDLKSLENIFNQNWSVDINFVTHRLSQY